MTPPLIADAAPEAETMPASEPSAVDVAFFVGAALTVLGWAGVVTLWIGRV